jgi:hypothetical protein
MHFREILVKDVRLNVERTLGLARIIFLSILWGANFVDRYSEYFFFFFAEQLVAQFFFFVGARHFLVCATFQTCATFPRQTEEAGPRLPSYRPTKYGQALRRLQRPQDFASSDVYLSSKIVVINYSC